jgi:hypothetical protein
VKTGPRTPRAAGGGGGGRARTPRVGERASERGARTSKAAAEGVDARRARTSKAADERAVEGERAFASSFGDALDEVAAAVFDGEHGRRRLVPLLARWDDEAAPLRDEDPDYAIWQVIRTDWALCDALAHDAAGPGDTWARRALRGRVLGFVPEGRHFSVGGTVAGLFEVWPGKVPWLRDCVGGLCVALADAVRLEPMADGGPAALWEARVALVDGRAHLCRPPLSYPLEVLEAVRDRQLRRFGPDGRPSSLALLRRARLRWRRAERADASVMFRLIRD